MRATLTIDDDLLRQLRQKVLDSGTPLKQVVNTMLRAGLRRSELVATEPAAYRLPTFSIGALAPGVDLTKATALAAALEDEARLEKMRQGQ